MGSLQKKDLLLECEMQRNRQGNAVEEQGSPLAIKSSSLECEGGRLGGSSGLTGVLSVSIVLVPGSSRLVGSWLISGEWAGEFRIPTKCF